MVTDMRLILLTSLGIIAVSNFWTTSANVDFSSIKKHAKISKDNGKQSQTIQQHHEFKHNPHFVHKTKHLSQADRVEAEELGTTEKAIIANTLNVENYEEGEKEWATEKPKEHIMGHTLNVEEHATVSSKMKDGKAPKAEKVKGEGEVESEFEVKNFKIYLILGFSNIKAVCI